MGLLLPLDLLLYGCPWTYFYMVTLVFSFDAVQTKLADTKEMLGQTFDEQTRASDRQRSQASSVRRNKKKIACDAF
ncbi:hypothetical protein NC651_002557 [Populus alba x Populus x berolinensis]|nr:hypothetical protein NC651_002557 [Populus alba x Populus x berolinensis]